MDDDIRLGVVLPTGKAQWGGSDPRELIAFARRAETLGLDSVWAADTLLRPVVEPIAMLSAAAAVTERVTLGTAAMLPALRRPVQAAQAIAALDLLSGGRAVVTVGAGFPRRSEAEYAASEVPWANRFARLDDTVALWRQLWTVDGPSSYHGKVLRFDHIPSGFPTVRPGGPPVWLGGATPAALDRVREFYDGWLPYPPDPADYTAGLERIGRKDVTPALFVTVLIADDVEVGRERLRAYAQASYRMPLEVVETIQLLVTGPVEHIVQVLGRYPDARHIVCRVGALGLDEQRQQLEMLGALRQR
jgi:alkanesulfonate monooxygenase SsuD/methylene tetrahydromethanopterin reductase-like flavin-dependent oxidoreductase (luciferase family)